MMKTRCITLSCVECSNAALSPVPQDNAQPAKNKNEIYARYGREPRGALVAVLGAASHSLECRNA
jgi:hypothetical protein